jgi:hypothetical protein
MKRLTILPVLIVLMACTLFVPTPTVPVTESPTLVTLPSETFAPMCTPPACNANETYFCPGNCPNGCGTVCATVTPDAALGPIATVQGAGDWIVSTEENLIFLDPSGVKPGFALQRVYAPLVDFFLVRDGNVYSLTDTGDGSLSLYRVYPKEHWYPNLDTRRDIEGSPSLVFSTVAGAW